VAVRLVLENAEVSEGKVAFDAMKAFGPNVAERSTVYVWPIEKRPRGAGGEHGSLHAKCAVADSSQLLVSSANLTEHAFTLNMELGVLIKGGLLPGRVDSYFDALIGRGTLQSVRG
jgi:phosphatidylserine/phosphatidylglycerophosphate/cardiolipin synthase-like enzyme